MPGNTPNEEELKTSAEDEATARRLVDEIMTPQEQEAFYAKVLEEEREVVRQRLKQIKENELREKAREQVRGEIKQGEIPVKPPQPWGEYLQENAGYAFDRIHKFAVVYITSENAMYGVGALAMGAMAATKKGATAAAAVKTGVAAAAAANPAGAVAGALLVGYAAYKYKHRNDSASAQNEAEAPAKWKMCTIL